MEYLSKIGATHSLSECNLNTKFSDKSQVDWSLSNLISIVSQDGIYILKPQLDISEGPFQIEFIRNPSIKFKHKILNNKLPTFDSLWHCLNNRQYIEVFLDPALTTNVEKLSLDTYPRRFRAAKWSPIIESFPKKCLLAAITVDYQLLIYTRRNNTWLVEVDLSSIYDIIWDQLNQSSTQICKDLNEKHLKTEDLAKVEGNFTTIQKCLRALSFCSLCWKTSTHNSPILMAATIPGDIVLWQLIEQSSSGYNSRGQQHSLDVKMILKTNLEFITSMHVSKDLLVVSARDGRVAIYDLSSKFEYLNLKNAQSTSSSVNDSINHPQTSGLTDSHVNLIEVTPTAIIWHPDNIEVADLFLQPVTDECFRIVMAKSTKIIWSFINYSHKSPDQPPSLVISNSFSAIDGSDPDHALHQTPATSLKPAGRSRAALIADDGSFFQLEFMNDHLDASPNFEAIRTGKSDLSRMVPRGLCTSPQGNMIAMISCISFMYDPAEIPAPTKVLVLPSINDKTFLIDCYEKLLDENWLREQKIRSPMDVFDRIDYLRSVSYTFNHEEGYALHMTLVDAINSVKLPVAKEQIVKLKIANFLLMKLMGVGGNPKSTMERGYADDSVLERASNLIMVHSLEDILAAHLPVEAGSSMEVAGDTDKQLAPNQIKSLGNFIRWLEMNPDERLYLRDKFCDRIKLFNQQHPTEAPETCPICATDINFESHKVGTCSNGHQFNRCARSMLVANLQSNSELVCEHCRRSFMSKLVWPTQDLWLCSFCQ